MNRLFSFIRDRHALLYKGFLFVASLAVIIYLYPREFRFRYDVSEVKGKPWSHDNLIAPFDFAIQKSKEEIALEEKQIRENFTPYFRFDPLAQLRPSDQPENYSRVWEIVKKVTGKGIRAVTNEAGKGPEDAILLVSDNVAEERKLGEFPDPIQADSIIRSLLKGDELSYWDGLRHKPLNATIVYDTALTNKFLRQSLENISDTRGALTKGQIIVSRGQIVDELIYQELISLQDAYSLQYQSGSNWALFLGHIVLAAFCLFILFQFIRLFRREILGNDARLLFILLMVVLTVCMSYLPSVFEGIPVLALPFCLLPVIMRAFFDTRLALFTHLVAMLIISICLPGDRFAFLFIQFLAGITAIFSIVNMRNRSQLFFSVIAILGVYVLLHFCLLLVTEAELDTLRSSDFINYAISALLVLLAYPLIFMFEKIFGFVSDVTLLELADTNNPLLRELAEKAPGTFQHSMQVANLAEEAIRRVGGNTLLVRAGALYHDIGKGDMPIYFIENQASGINPHDELSFEESASIIISHVLRGIEKAKAAKLPDQVVDFIRTHHGTTNTAYFLTLYKKNNPEENIDEELFRYPGPIPYSKETAVLMMADAVEASSRSLHKYDAESIDGLVERIIDHQADQHQFDNADITMKDITAIKKIFKKKLKSIYHVRVEYPH
jgi:hypothetical protein